MREGRKEVEEERRKEVVKGRTMKYIYIIYIHKSVYTYTYIIYINEYIYMNTYI